MSRDRDAGPTLSAAVEGMVARAQPLPLVALLATVVDWLEERHLELLAEEGFDDVRRAHNAVFVHTPADGIRLTALADRAGISKQAMGELVTDLEAKGYLRRAPDPADGRAKLILWADRGLDAHEATLRAFARLEDELEGVVGAPAHAQLRATLTALFGRVALGAGPEGT